jgi:toxin FitB
VEATGEYPIALPVRCPECRLVALEQRKMSLGDSLIAATALAQGLTLVTRNIRDFQWIETLDVLNPFEDRT